MFKSARAHSARRQGPIWENNFCLCRLRAAAAATRAPRVLRVVGCSESEDSGNKSVVLSAVHVACTRFVSSVPARAVDIPMRSKICAGVNFRK